MAINFNELPSDKPAGNATVVPPGKYLAKIEKAEMKSPKNTNEDGTPKKDYLLLTLELTDMESNKMVGRVWDNVIESQAGLLQYKLKRLIQALQLPITGEFELKDLTKMVPGRSMLVDIALDKDLNGNDKSVVDALSGMIYYSIEAPAKPEPATDNAAPSEDVTY